VGGNFPPWARAVGSHQVVCGGLVVGVAVDQVDTLKVPQPAEEAVPVLLDDLQAGREMLGGWKGKERHARAQASIHVSLKLPCICGFRHPSDSPRHDALPRKHTMQAARIVHSKQNPGLTAKPQLIPEPRPPPTLAGR
jgi:hypothetical protein